MKAVFFDAGSTLIHMDTLRIGRVIERVLGRGVTAEAWAAADYVGRAAVEDAMASDTGSDSGRWLTHFRAMLRELGVSDEEFARVGPAVKQEHERRHLWSRVVPGTGEALQALRQAGLFVAVISNADGTVEQLLEKVGLRRHLAFVIDSGVVKVEKPDARIFHLALERAGVSAAESYHVGDLFPVDVVGSRGVGMTPVLLDPLGRYGQRGVRTAPDVPALARELVSAREAA